MSDHPYFVAHHDALLIDRGAEGRFELLDRDRLDLLHRMSTNNVNVLKAGEGCETVLTTAIARIIDRLIVYNRGETALALCGAGRTATVRGWLQKHIFFQDRVKTHDLSTEWAQFGLFGSGAAAIADRFIPNASTLSRHHFGERAFGEGSLIVARSYPLAGDGYTLLVPVAAREAVIAEIGIGVCTGEIGAQIFDMLRIETGVPLSGHELSEDYIPLEAGLWDAVSSTKGCYIGQEIIARMESRHKLARSLVQLELERLLPEGTLLHTSDRTVGSITSVAALPTGKIVALGYIKTDALDSPLTALIQGGDPVSVARMGVTSALR